MADDGVGVVLVLVEEVVGARECNLVDVLVDFLFCHTEATVADGERALVLVETDVDGQVAQLALEVAFRGIGFELLRGVDGVRDELAQEDFVVAV